MLSVKLVDFSNILTWLWVRSYKFSNENGVRFHLFFCKNLVRAVPVINVPLGGPEDF